MGDINFVDRRRQSIGGSEISAVLGINPYVTPVDVYLEKTGRKEPFAGSITTRRGNYLEPLVADEYAKATGYEVYELYQLGLEPSDTIRIVGTDVILLHPDYHFLRATIDRIAITPFGSKIVAEIKTAVGWGVNKFLSGVPEYYRLQAIWNRGIANYHMTMLEDIMQMPVLLDDKYDCFDIPYSEYEFDWMVEQAVAFWNNHILADNPPTPASVEEAKTIFVDTDGTTVDADEELVKLIAEMAQIKENMSSAESETSMTKTALARMQEAYAEKELLLRNTLGNTQYVKLGNRNLITYSPVAGRAYFDVDLFKEDQPELYQKYMKRKPSSRQLRINYKILGE